MLYTPSLCITDVAQLARGLLAFTRAGPTDIAALGTLFVARWDLRRGFFMNFKANLQPSLAHHFTFLETVSHALGSNARAAVAFNRSCVSSRRVDPCTYHWLVTACHAYLIANVLLPYRSASRLGPVYETRPKRQFRWARKYISLSYSRTVWVE